MKEFKAIAGGWKDIYEIKESKFTEEPKNNLVLMKNKEYLQQKEVYFES